MKWAEAKAAAKQRLPSFLAAIKRMRGQHGAPDAITLTVYEDELSYRTAHPTDPLSHQEHGMITEALQRLAKRAGEKVVIVKSNSKN